MKITVYDAAGVVLAEAEPVSTARRLSVRGAAYQRQLDGMFEPRAASATIGDARFVFDRMGKSHFIMEGAATDE